MIIGICGLAGAGKDTTADILCRSHGFAKLAFADPMKRFAKEVFDFSHEQMWGPSSARNAPDPRYRRMGQYGPCLELRLDEGLTPREALQKLGTEWGRSCYPEVWVEYGIRAAKRLDGREGFAYSAEQGVFRCTAPPIQGVAISDVRFKNELVAVKAAGGKVVRVVRDGAGLGGTAGLHQSEREQAEIPDTEFDYVILNNTTISDLAVEIASMLRRFS